MTEIAIGENVFRIGKLNAIQQLHVSRKIAPVLPKILPAMVASKALMVSLTEENPDLEGLSSMLSPVAEALAGMPDADAEYVFNECLSVVQLQQGNAFVNIWNADTQRSQFDFIDFFLMIRLVVQVIWGSLGNFTNGFLAKSPQA
jgi:hypothetical protein